MEGKIKAILIECPECEGKGKVFEPTWGYCRVPISECCGGCGHDVKCLECGGTGEVEEMLDEYE